MALIHVVNSEGQEVLVHSSVFDQARPAVATGSWADVWAKADAPANTAADAVGTSEPEVGHREAYGAGDYSTPGSIT